MFSKSDKPFEFVKRPRPAGALDFVRYSCPPKAVVGEKSGAAVFAQHLESLKYVSDGPCRCPGSFLDVLFEEAKKGGRTLPAFDAYVEACVSLGCVRNCRTAYFNDVDTLGFYLREYRSVPVELLLTDTTMNAREFEISEPGEPVKGYTKGFVAFRMTDDLVVLQNTLGENCGAIGFNCVPMDVFKKLLVKGAAFTVEEDGL